MGSREGSTPFLFCKEKQYQQQRHHKHGREKGSYAEYNNTTHGVACVPQGRYSAEVCVKSEFD
jgi:hypothetical protein